MRPLVFFTWNVLATGYIRRAFYPRVAERFLDPQWRHPAIVRRARELDADVLCLQEVDAAVFAALAATLEPAGYAAAHALKEGRPDGCATFVRAPWTLADSRRHPYRDGAGGAPSGHLAQLVVVAQGDAHIAVLNTHLKWDPPDTSEDESWGLRQATEALDLLRREPTPAQILCGDLNVTPEAVVMRALRGGGLLDAHERAPASTSNANGVAKRIDYVLWRGPLRPTPQTPRAIADATPLPSEQEPSDHLPLGATLAMP